MAIKEKAKVETDLKFSEEQNKKLQDELAIAHSLDNEQMFKQVLECKALLDQSIID